MIGPAPSLGLAAVAGLTLGSFAVTAGLRMGRGETALKGRSRCDACARSLGFVQTVPVLSYIGLRGACAGCGARIDATHLWGEAAGVVVVTTSLVASSPIRVALLAVLGLVLIAAVTVDWKVRRLPDGLTAAIAVIGLALSAISSLSAAVTGLMAATVLAAVLLGLRWINRHQGRDSGLGLGDVKLLAVLALWLGIGTPWLIAGASLLGLAMMAVLRPADGRLPFGPAIALAAWVAGISQEIGLWPTTI